MDDRKPQTYVIGKRTPITVGLLISMVGGVAWLTDMKYQTQANAKEILDVKQKQSDTNVELVKIEKWLSAIGQKLKVPEPPGGR